MPESEVKERTVYQATERARQAMERRLIPRIRRELRRQGARAAARVRSAASPAQAVQAADEVARDVEVATGLLERIYRQVVPSFGNAAVEGVRNLKQEPEPQRESYWLQRVREFLLTDGAEMVTEITATTQDQIQQVLIAGTQEGLGVEAMARNLEEEWTGISRNRARTIVRTEVVSASNFASQEGAEFVARDTGLELQKEWIATADGRTRDTHASADGQIVGLEERFTVGGYPARYPGDPSLPAAERVSCFPGTELTRVNPESVKRAFRAPYKGQMVVLYLASGQKVTVTPNHPILTVHGWKAANLIEKSDRLVKPTVGEGCLGCFDIENTPTPIEQVFDSVGVSDMRIPYHAVDFYGDRPDGNIDVVNASSLLQDRRKASSGESSGNLPFTSTHLAERVLFRQCCFFMNGLKVGRRLATNNAMRSLDIRHVVSLAATVHHQLVRSGLASALDAGLLQPTLDDGTRNPKRLCQPVFGFASPVSLHYLFGSNIATAIETLVANLDATVNKARANWGDAYTEVLSDFLDRTPGSVPTNDVVNVEVIRHWKGEVYTLETRTGMYEISGVLARNCRCTLGHIPVSESDRKFVETSTRTWRDERNAAIRSAYPAERDEKGKWQAMAALAEEHGLSEHTVHDIVYERGHYS